MAFVDAERSRICRFFLFLCALETIDKARPQTYKARHLEHLGKNEIKIKSSCFTFGK